MLYIWVTDLACLSHNFKSAISALLTFQYDF